MATLAVVDHKAIADAKAIEGAVTPNGVLHEPRESCRKSCVESPSIDLRGSVANDVGTAPWLVTSWPIGVIGAAICQNAGAMKKVMDQGVDHGGACTQGKPFGPISGEL